jgi:DNA-binding CsgD family transcriptional regulator
MLVGSALNGVSEELYLYRYGNGVKLAKPNLLNRLGHRIKKILSLPFNIYFKNTNGAFLYLNKMAIEATGFTSMKNALGKSVYDISPLENAHIISENDKTVMQSNRIRLLEEHAIRNDGVDCRYLSVKAPWYDDHNKIKGVFGCSIMLDDAAFIDSLALIVEMGLLSPTKNNHAINSVTNNLKVNFTNRENDVLRLLIRGKTAREIAAVLELSKRTVEHHLENMRGKLQVNSKSELIEKVIDHITNLNQ